MQAKNMLKKPQIGWVTGKLSAKCLLTISGSKRFQLWEPHTDSVFCEDSVSFFFSPGNRMIDVPTEKPLDDACQNQGEEMESEHEGHVWMISQPQLPHLEGSKAPGS